MMPARAPPSIAMLQTSCALPWTVANGLAAILDHIAVPPAVTVTPITVSVMSLAVTPGASCR
ncbi:Hypothetical protein FKW44_004891 [Caligus rogercresseyi]|uniref:Uncharacterized protein n=1 Tax=Caligus rogercresseyi TaxID=217165 RepID=A0A7T8HMS4_CALRO|nr:Hypothetical protein FKW44_004891 [Caligus rogercresseyi]